MEKLRIDKWLWAARFYKTRGLASKAVTAGKVNVAGERVKPAYLVRLNDVLTITKERDTRELTVLRLLEKRGSATVAATMYQESEESVQQREASAQSRKIAYAAEPNYGRRPDKRSRRKLGALLGKREWPDR